MLLTNFQCYSFRNIAKTHLHVQSITNFQICPIRKFVQCTKTSQYLDFLAKIASSRRLSYNKQNLTFLLICACMLIICFLISAGPLCFAGRGHTLVDNTLIKRCQPDEVSSSPAYVIAISSLIIEGLDRGEGMVVTIH